jgi:beta-lactam-binding protein with PASTA domain
MKTKKINLDDLLKASWWKNLFFENSKKALAVHLVLVLICAFFGLLAFFNLYLPMVTNHGETISVPDLRGLDLNDVKRVLEGRDLRFEVTDSVYNSEFPAFTVVAQYPVKDALVKVDRKIYLTVNKSDPPSVRLPNILDGSFKNAELILKNLGLTIGKVEYIPDMATNAILKVSIKGREFSEEEIEMGIDVVKGTPIDLVLGDGMGNSVMRVPDLIGMPMDEVEIYLSGLNIGVGRVEFVDTLGVAAGTVLKQYPPSERGSTIRVGEIIDLWIANNSLEN